MHDTEVKLCPSSIIILPLIYSVTALPSKTNTAVNVDATFSNV